MVLKQKPRDTTNIFREALFGTRGVHSFHFLEKTGVVQIRLLPGANSALISQIAARTEKPFQIVE